MATEQQNLLGEDNKFEGKSKIEIAEEILTKIRYESNPTESNVQKMLRELEEEVKIEGTWMDKFRARNKMRKKEFKKRVEKGNLFKNAEIALLMMPEFSQDVCIKEVTKLPIATVRMLRFLHYRYGKLAFEHVEVVDGKLTMK